MQFFYKKQKLHTFTFGFYQSSSLICTVHCPITYKVNYQRDTRSTTKTGAKESSTVRTVRKPTAIWESHTVMKTNIRMHFGEVS